MTLCNNNDQTWFSDTLTSARPLGVVKTLALQARISTPPNLVEISSNGLGGDSVTDGRTDGRIDGRAEAIAISPTLF